MKFMLLLFTFFSVSFLFNISITAQTKNLFQYEEKKVVGSENDFLQVKHITMRGSNFEIGKKLAEIGIKNHNLKPAKTYDSIRVIAQKNYIKKNYPIHYERMKGVAAGFGLNFENNNFDFSVLGYAMPSYGCSAVFYPKEFTQINNGILSRNFEFTTGTIQGLIPNENQKAVLAEPYIFEIYPDEGYASLLICAFDLYGAMDGINSEGLTVAILADDETPSQFPVEPTMKGDVGVFELLSTRYLLDNCKNVEEAKQALLELKHFYFFAPLHYIIADKSGKSFIFEFSPTRNQTYITDLESRPLCVTNHLVYKHQNNEELPEGNSFERYKTLYDLTSAIKRFSMDEIKEYSNEVSADNYPFQSDVYAPNRTIWQGIYNVDQNSLEVAFYLGDKKEADGTTKIKRSDYFKFQLQK